MVTKINIKPYKPEEDKCELCGSYPTVGDTALCETCLKSDEGRRLIREKVNR